MSKKTAKPAAAETDAGAPKKRSKVKLALFTLVPLLLLGGGGYAGYAFYLAPQGEAAHAAGEGTEAGDAAHAEAPKDPVKVSAVPSVIAAETSFTHSWAIAVMTRTRCGEVPTPTLKAASEAEAAADGLLVNLSWQAAARRTQVLDDRSCDYLLTEIEDAEAKAQRVAAAAAAPEDGHGAAPAQHAEAQASHDEASAEKPAH